MRIGLIDVDGHNFPNLALMRISAYHKAHIIKRMVMKWNGGGRTLFITTLESMNHFIELHICSVIHFKLEKN